MNGFDLLHQYRQSGSEHAFSELVRRFANLVYSVARRQVGDEPLAEEVAQSVFVRPALARILQSESEPGLLRMIAANMFVPSMMFINGLLITPNSCFDGAPEDLFGALKMNEKQGFRFTIVDLLSQYFAVHPDDAAVFRDAILPLLSDPQSQQRALAAFALASWPGEKPAELKQIFLNELRDRSQSSYRAASALGKLGPDAAEAVPELLAYAEATKSWAAGYASNALEAACRIKPELRSKYSEIDQKLKIEEAAEKPGSPPAATMGEWVTGLVQGSDDALNNALAANFRSNEHPADAKQALIARLEAEVARAPENQKAALAKAIAMVQTMPAEEPSAGPPSLSAANLTLDARVLLTEKSNPNESQIEAALERFDAEHPHSDPKMKVTAESYAKLAQALREVDPNFQAEWRKALLLNYPWLDRVLPAEKP